MHFAVVAAIILHAETAARTKQEEARAWKRSGLVLAFAF
jgi:hypothetical protein